MKEILIHVLLSSPINVDVITFMLGIYRLSCI